MARDKLGTASAIGNGLDTSASRLLAAGLVLGVGLGGFIDGIVLHQILQWHHILTDHGRYTTFPAANVSDLEDNTAVDGLFMSPHGYVAQSDYCFSGAR